MEQQYKLSHYSMLIEVPDSNEYLLYSSRNGGLLVLPTEHGQFLESLSGKSSFFVRSYPQYYELLTSLIEYGMIVLVERNEVAEVHNEFTCRTVSYKEPKADIGITIGTTINCNMGCPYCFEFHKPNKSLTDLKVVDGLINYIESIITKNPDKKWGTMSVTWYGGEPLLNPDAIRQISPRLQLICERFNIRFKADIVTNGLLLTQENWQILLENRIRHVQCTIDGSKETHDVLRPLKIRGARNYEQILENLALQPDGISLSIRINTDKKVAKTIPKLLDDLESYGIWPQRYKKVSLAPSQLRSYQKTGKLKNVEFLDNKEFSDEFLEIRKIKLRAFNKWARKTGTREGKLSWLLPELQLKECATWSSPYHIVVDPDGNIHKCWETIHESKYGVSNVFSDFKEEVFEKYSNYDRTKLHKECLDCKFLPVCEKLKCAHDAINSEKPNCTVWKTEIGKILSTQYKDMNEHPDLIGSPISKLMQKDTTHANK